MERILDWLPRSKIETKTGNTSNSQDMNTKIHLHRMQILLFIVAFLQSSSSISFCVSLFIFTSVLFCSVLSFSSIPYARGVARYGERVSVLQMYTIDYGPCHLSVILGLVIKILCPSTEKNERNNIGCTLHRHLLNSASIFFWKGYKFLVYCLTKMFKFSVENLFHSSTAREKNPNCIDDTAITFQVDKI